MNTAIPLPLLLSLFSCECALEIDVEKISVTWKLKGSWVDCQWKNRNPSDFITNIFICLPKKQKQRSYGIETTWEWGILTKIFSFLDEVCLLRLKFIIIIIYVFIEHPITKSKNIHWLSRRKHSVLKERESELIENYDYILLLSSVKYVNMKLLKHSIKWKKYDILTTQNPKLMKITKHKKLWTIQAITTRLAHLHV